MKIIDKIKKALNKEWEDIVKEENKKPSSFSTSPSPSFSVSNSPSFSESEDDLLSESFSSSPSPSLSPSVSPSVWPSVSPSVSSGILPSALSNPGYNKKLAKKKPTVKSSPIPEINYTREYTGVVVEDDVDEKK